MNKNLKVITDSSCNLSAGEIEKFGIMVIPLKIKLGKETIKENSSYDLTTIAYKINSEKLIPKVISPSVDEFFKTYSLVYPKFNNIISIHLSSGISDIILEAKNAQALLYDAKINVADSFQAEVGLKPVVVKIAAMAQNNLPFHVALNTVKLSSSQFYTFIVADNIDFVNTNTNFSIRKSFFSLHDAKARYLFSASGGSLFLIDKISQSLLIDRLSKVMDSIVKENKIYARILYALDKDLALNLSEVLKTKFDIQVQAIDEMSLSSMCRFGTHSISIGFSFHEDFFNEFNIGTSIEL
jgi:DegV family protein with EDD domain